MMPFRTLAAILAFSVLAASQATRTKELSELEKKPISIRNTVDELLREQIALKQQMREMVSREADSYVYTAPARKTSAAFLNGPGHTINVTKLTDSGPGSLRAAIFNAVDGDSINIVVHGTILLTSGELLVDKSLTIRGPGRTHGGVSGNGLSRVFHIMPGMAVGIDGIAITNGLAIGAFPASAGGGIFSDHAQLTVSNCSLSGNSARFGGGIFSNSRGGGSATLTINNSTVSGNRGQYGSGIFSGGGFFNMGPSGSASLTVSNSTISDNGADYPDEPPVAGVGIFNDGFSGNATLTVNRSALINNGFSSYGGGIFNNGDSGVATLALTDTTFSGNKAYNGGGIFNDGTSSVSPGYADLTLINCTLNGQSGGGINNSAAGGGNAIATLTDVILSDNHGISGGGIQTTAVSGGNATLTLNNTTLSENTAGFGAGIFHGSGTGGISTITVNNGTFDGNRANPWCGGIYQTANNGGSLTLTMNNSILGGNSADSAGGICNTASNGSSATATLNNSTVSGNSAGYIGGAIDNGARFDSFATLTLNSSTVNGNFAALFGGGIRNESSDNSYATTTLINSTLSGNSTTYGPESRGGGVYNNAYYGGISTLNLYYSTLSGNSAGPGSGGGIYNDNDGTVNLRSTILNASSPENILSPSGPITSYGYNLSSDSGGGFLTGSGDQINTDPLLGPLKNNGGPTMTHALLVHSPAIDAGDPNFNPYAFLPPLIYDQRNGPGFTRVFNGRIDIGAFESKHP